MQKREKRILPLLITILIMAFIFVQSALPADLSQQESNFIVKALADILSIDAENLSFIVRKCAHFTEYLVLGMSICASVREYLPGKPALLAWVIGALYAVTDEFHQAFVPGRSCELRDMVIDTCGVAAGVLIMTAIHRRAAKRVVQE